MPKQEKIQEEKMKPAEAEQTEEEKLELEKSEGLQFEEIIEAEKQEKIPVVDQRAAEFDSWKPKTELGRKVKEGEINSLSQVLENGVRIMEPEIMEFLCPDIQTDLLLVGQAKGKFGGGQRRVFKQTQKKTKEGNKPRFSTYAVVGNKDGAVGISCRKAKETVPAREKALRNAKLNVIQIRRGCGSWQCHCAEQHSIPFAVEGKCGSVRIVLRPAPKGTGLCVEKECAKILALAGIKDVWSKTFGHTATKTNLIDACFKALKQLSSVKVQPVYDEKLGIVQQKV